MPSLVKAGTNRYKSDRWKARVKINYKERFLGYFDTHEEAHQAERAARLRLTGREEPIKEWKH